MYIKVVTYKEEYVMHIFKPPRCVKQKWKKSLYMHRQALRAPAG